MFDAPVADATAQTKAKNTPNANNNGKPTPTPKNYNWLLGLLALAILGGGWWLIWGRKAAPDNATIIAKAKAFYEANPFKVGDQIVGFNDGDGGDGGDFDLPDFDADHEQMLHDHFQTLISAAAFQCMGAIEGGNPGAACRGIVEYFNEAHRVIERMHPILRFAAHAAYCLQLSQLFVCCDIETLKKLGLECACGMDIPHKPYPAFSDN